MLFLRCFRARIYFCLRISVSPLCRIAIRLHKLSGTIVKPHYLINIQNVCFSYIHFKSLLLIKLCILILSSYRRQLQLFSCRILFICDCYCINFNPPAILQILLVHCRWRCHQLCNMYPCSPYRLYSNGY